MFRHRMGLAGAVALAGLWSAVAHAQVQFVDFSTGQSSSSTTVAASNVIAATNHLYLAAISTKPHRSIQSVSGLGLTWAAVNPALATQCSGQSETNGSIGWAIGTPT